jgi:biotin carboxyl carrier protein
MKREFSITLDGAIYKIVVDGNSVLVNGRPFVVGFEDDKVLVDGAPLDVEMEGATALVDGISYSLSVEGLEQERSAAPRAAAKAAAGEGAVAAIMPGKVIRVLVSVGDKVAEGSVVCILEAMKMENELKSPKAGVVKAIHVQPGRDVEMGAVLVEIE